MNTAGVTESGVTESGVTESEVRSKTGLLSGVEFKF